MLKTLVILILLGVIGLMGVSMQVLWEKLKRARRHADSWKLAYEHLEKELRGW